MERLSDEQLLAAVLAGEMDALALLVERHQQMLTGYLNRLMGGDWDLAQDLTQETFLRVLGQRVPRGERPFKPWLCAIATNLARDHVKSASVRLSTHLDPEQETEVVDHASGPEEHMLVHEQQGTILAALNTLSVEYRATIWLRFYGDLSLQEIAAALEIPLGTVKSRLTVGLRRLRDALEPAPKTCKGGWK